MPELDDRRKALLARLLAAEGFHEAEPARIALRGSNAPARLSFAQQRLWLLEQMALPGPPAYNMPAAYLLEGDLDIAALREAFARLLARHEILRTCIVTVGGEPRQAIVPDANVEVAIGDLTDAADPVAAFTHEAAALARTPFDLTTAPLVRVAVKRLGPARYGLAVVLHHLIADGWSLPVLLREVMAAYQDARQGRPTAMPPLPLQYADYAEWHRTLIETGGGEPHREYWLQQFAALAPPVELPSDGPRPASRSVNGAAVRRRLDSALASGLRTLSRRQGTSVFTTLLTAVNVLLSRYTGRRDLVVGTPVAGRVRPELADQIGFYVNMLPLRTLVDGAEAFTTLLGRVARATGDALAHEIYPFDQLVHELPVERDLGRSPLFDVVLVVEPSGDTALGFEGLVVAPLELPRESSKFDVTFHVVEYPDHLDLTIEYRTDLFQPARIERLARHFEHLLRAAVANPRCAVDRLPLMPADDRARVLAWGAATAQSAWSGSVLARFETQARRQPGTTAATCGDQSLTYGALNARANQLARRLVDRGVGADARVGVCLDRSLDLVVAILGVLKAGGAYVPLDPSYPAERLQYLMADSGVGVVLTHGAEARAKLQSCAAVVLDLADEWGTDSGEDLSRPVHPEQAAYVIYTSGSTGQPKGCVVTHRNLARLMTATEAWYGFGAQDVWTLFHSYAFDFSVWELWGALAYGGQLVVVPYWVSRAPDAFLDLLARKGVTVLNQTPSAFRELVRVDAQAPRGLALRYVIFGGEALDVAALAPWFQAHGDRAPRLVNMYGITETTVHVTYRPVGLADLAAGAGSVIGAPIPDLRFYVLDPSLEPVPIGVPGEIYVGGAGVCRGYLGRPALTAERFIPDPFSTDAGARLYRSGDLGRWTESGDVEYLGRADTQVKIRGFRIEVGEIEAALRAVPGVTDAIVIARAHAGGTQLVAYVIAPDPAHETSAFRAALARVLPDYMVPAHVVRIAARPLTAHGKLDVGSLPAPEGDAETIFAAPETAAERALCDIWAEALGVTRVGIDDNYFALGGDSILALRVIAAARARDVHFGIRDLYQRPTIRALVSSTTASDPDVPAVEREPFVLVEASDRARLPAEAEDAYPLSRLQAGMFFHSALDPASAIFQDVFSYRVRLPWQEGAFRAAAAGLADRHPILRTSFHWEPYREPLQVVWKRAVVPVTIDDLRAQPTHTHDTIISEALEAARRTPFDPSVPSLLRLHVHVRADRDLQVTASFHHAILDGWSFATLMAEVMTRYLAITDGRDVSIPLAMPRGRFRDFVALEQEAARSADSRRFWAGHVASLPATRVPRWPGAPFGAGAGAHEVALADAAVVQSLAQDLGVPVKSVCLAAHMAVLAMLAGNRDVVTGLTTNGRPDTEGADAVLGLFLNTVPFRLDVGHDSWRSLIARTFDAERALLPHRRFPLPDIKALAGGRDLYDAGFNFVHFHVYSALGDRVEVLGLSAFEQTDYALVANFSVDPRDGRLALRLSYDAAQFPASQIAAIGGYYARALHGLAHGPDASWRATALLGDDERRVALAAGRGSEVAAPSWSVVSRFDAQARLTPHAVAVRVLDRSLTYGALEARSNRAARRLRSLGVGTDTLVGICLPRSEWLVIGLLATLKAGGAYVPIDVSYPEDRITYLLGDSRAEVVLTDGSRPGLDITTLASASEDEPADPEAGEPLPDVQAAHLAYVIYTSGSTGRPKGTMVSHGALAHYLAWAVDAYRVTETSRSIVHSSVSFDATITSLWTPLLTGGTVELVPEDQPVRSLAQALASDHTYGLVKITPAHLDLLRHELGDDAPRAKVGAFVIGGEALLDATLAWWRRAAPGARLINEYGPTETVVGCAVFEDRGVSGPAAVPIGRPIDRTRLWVLDAQLEPVPTGTPGEIYIGGAGVARGYLRRPDLTAERFLPDPHAGAPGARMYRTGDLGRWRPDGELEYLGRNDSQVKVRGHRVELGEVEAVLSEHPAVTETAVIARSSGTTHDLIAFVVGTDPTLDSLRTFVARRLPEPLVPSRFVVLPSLPLTAHGKVDRQALLGLDADALPSLRPYVSPRTEAEQVLAAIWTDVLRLTRVGTGDDYFALGGDSLKALQVVARAARSGWRVRVRDLFDFPTIAELARHASRDLLPVSQGPVAGEVPLTPIQCWFFEDHAGPHHHYNQAVSLRWRERVDKRVLAEALAALADHHDALRLRFVHDGRSWQQAHAAPGVVVDVVDVRDERDLDGFQAGLDLANGPPLRAAIVRGADADRVVLAIHHLVIDGVSWRVLLEDLDTAYRQRRSGQSMSLPLKTTSFQDWAGRVAAHASSAALVTEVDYWRDVVADAGTLSLDGPAQAGSPDTVRVHLDAATTDALFGVAHRTYHTQANDLLLAGLGLALEATFGLRHHLLLTVEGHGRYDGLDADVSRTVGWFTSRYPVRLALGDADLRARIRRVKEDLRQVPHHGFGYGLLRHLGAPHIRGAVACRPAVGFNYLGRFDESSASGVFDVTDEPTGLVVDPGWTRDHPLEVIATVVGGRLELRVEATRGCVAPDRLHAFADAYVSSLRQIVEHASGREAEPTPSDLTYTGLTLGAFDALLTKHGPGPGAVEDILPLSPMQEGFLYHALAAESGAYFEQSAYRLTGRIEPAVFEAAWNHLLSRHPNLRVVYWPDEGLPPMQVVLRDRRVEFHAEDWRGLDIDVQRQLLAAFREADRRRGFDLTTDPLVRVALFQVDETTMDAVWSFPHLLLDGWSAGLLLAELLAIYAALVEEQPVSLPEPVPYRRYLQWLARQDRGASTTYWARYLDGFDESTSVPVVRPLGLRQPYEPRSMPWRLGSAETQGLKALATRLHVTLATLIQTLWAMLLASYTERDEVVFGVTISGRPEALPDVERMVGLFINTVPVRVRIERTDGIADVARRIQADGLAAQAYAACPLAEIQAQSPLSARLFDHILVFENYPQDSELRGLGSVLTVQSSDVFEQVHYDLGLLVAEAPSHLALRFLANGAVYGATDLARVAAHFDTLTRAVLAHPARPAWQHTIVPDAERRQLAAFNETVGAPRIGVTLVDLLDEQAARTPERVALIHGGARSTYAALHGRADALARVLRRRGVGPETLVGVCLTRRPDLIVALLAVLKAGGAYVPLDPAYPPARLRFLLDDADVALVLTEEGLRASLPGDQTAVLCVDGPLSEPEGVVDDTLQPVEPANLAYVIYTSGSTGTPKGTAITHAAAAALVEWGRHTYAPEELRGVLASTSICFDLSVFEIFVTLATGGTIVLADDALALPTLEAAQEVTLVNTVPSAMAVLLRMGGLPPSVRTVNLAGEPLRASLVDALYAVPTVGRVCDLYGPSEDTTYSTYALRAPGGPETIGGPIPHTQTEIYLLDRRMMPVPIGVVGELYLASAKLARGYLHRPDLTAERFVPHPWGRTPGARLYRTGDRARYREDGQLEFLGRLDHQVKVRGFRVELGEIEAALRATGWVRDTVVVARADAAGDPQLVAYIVAEDSAPRDASAYAARLRTMLPDFLVPPRLVLLAALPLTPNGKLDRRALPAPDAPAGLAAPPRSALESALVATWREALGVAQVGVFDDFFDHGGHSLIAARLVARARQEHGLDLSLRDVFLHPTIAGLAEVIAARARVAAAPIATIAPASDYAVAYGQRRLWVLEQLRGEGPAAYHVPAAFLLHGHLDLAALSRAFQIVIERHEVLRTRLVVVDGEPRQHVLPHVDVPLDVADWSGHDRPRDRFEAEVRRLAATPFDLAQAPLVRIAVRQLAPTTHGLAIVIHHIATDGGSIPILMRELRDGYQEALECRASTRPPLRVQYRDYAAWHRARVEADAMAPHRAYWRGLFADTPTPLDLPADRTRPSVQTVEGHQYRGVVDVALTDRVRTLAAAHGASVFMTLLAASAVWLARMSGQDDVTVGSPMAGRTHPDLDEQIGYYVNTVPLRIRVARGESFVDLLGRTRDIVSAAFAHQEYPFDRLVEDLQIPRDLARSPLFDVMVAMETAADATFALPGVQVEPLALDYRVSKFDLTLTFQDRGADLAMVFEYNTALFEAETMKRMARRLETLVRAIVDHPEEIVGRLPILPDDERRAVVDEWNWAPLTRARGRSLATLFEEQVARTPEAVAVVCDGRRLSYREVDARANAIAAHLIAHHAIAPEDPVGLQVEVSDHLIVGMLGILKAGGAYVPLDPSYPRERIQWVLQDAGIRVVVTTGSTPGLPDDVARLNPASLAPRAAPVARSIESDETLAYILYTSGSTGRPKGVAVPHRGVVNLLADCQRRAPLEPGDGGALWTSVSFDVSVYEICSTLLVGGRLHLVPEALRSQPRAYFAWLADEQIASAYVAPFHLADLREFLTDSPVRPPLTRLLVGVEPIEEGLLAAIRAQVPGLRIINGYGPTEASVCATLYDVPEAAPGARVTPIGRAVANTGVYVVDSLMQPVGFGVIGDIVLAGDGLARGYHGNPAATAAAFVPSPFGPAPGMRLYRTGDRGRRLPSGHLVFVGRDDRQVKIRGHRVEIDEVERALLDHGAVADAAVVTVAAGATRELVAYVVAGADEPSVDALRAGLQTRLPDYMIPARYVVLDELPRTPNGKVDRRALSERQGRVLRVQAGYVAPRTARELALARVWTEVLGTVQVGVDDNYFALGGDSIKAIQIAARASAHGLAITLRDVFAHPTVAALARVATEQTRRAAQGPVTGHVPFTAIQEWFIREHAGPYDHFNQAVLLRWTEPVDEDVLRVAVAALLAHHDALRTQVSREPSGAWTQTIAATAAVGWTIDDLRDREHAEAVASMERRADAIHASLDLAAGRLVAGGVFRLPDGDRVLLVIHHLVVDGVSWRVLLEDLDLAYRQRRDGAVPQLPLKTDSFQAWATAARHRARGQDLEAERAYWVGVCAAAPAPLTVTGDTTARDTVQGSLDPGDTRRLLAGARAAGGADTATLLLTGLAGALAETLGRSRTCLDLEGHGREAGVADLDVGRTVGWFTSLYPFILDAGDTAQSGDAALRAAIDAVRQALQCVPRQGVGYGLLRYLGDGPVESLAYRADVGFNYLGQFDTDGATRTFGFATESSGRPLPPHWAHDHALDVSAHVEGGRLRIALAFDPARIAPAQGQRLLDGYVGGLRRIAAIVQSEADEFEALRARHGVPATEIEAVSALSPMQEGLLFNALFDRDSEAYFEQLAYRIQGDVDPVAFEGAWNALLARHANLRVSIWHEQSSRPVVVVRRDRRVHMHVEDWTTLAPSEQRARLDDYRAADRRSGFDLERDALIRVGLFRTARQTWEVVWSYPHLLLDGWSTGILLGEFLAIYADPSDRLPEPVPYTRYLDWIAAQDQDAALGRWRTRLDGYDGVASIPSDDPPPQHYLRNRLSASWTLAPDLTRHLVRAAANHGLTMNTIVQTLWGLLLGRLAGSTDVVFGSTVSGRPEGLAGVEGMVGLFINTLPVRVRWHEADSFVDLARRVQNEAVAGQADGFVPLAEIQAASAVRGALFDHLVIFENYPLDQRVRQLGEGGGQWRIEAVDVFEETQYPLVLAVAPAEDRVDFRCAYDPSRYSPKRIERLTRQWEQIVACIAAGLEQPVRVASVLTDDERQMVIDTFARAQHSAGPPETLINLLESSRDRTPEALAVSFGQQRLTQGELHDRAGRVAAALCAAGVGPDMPVAICLERSLELVVVMLGVLRAGGAYLPIDPDYPAARIRFMLEDSHAAVIVTRRGLLADDVAPAARRVFVDAPEARRVFLDEETASGEAAPQVRWPESLAYVLYTSGSTGTPKGVGIPHRALSNHMRWMARVFPLRPDDRVLQKTPFSFDASVWEFWAPLVEGATLVMAPPGVHQDPRLLADTIYAERITVLQVVPTLLQALLDEPGFGACAQLRRVFVGGEALSLDLQQRFFAALPAARLINLYGPTEVTIDATSFECQPGEAQRAVPIGAPVDGLTAYVLDGRMEPAPVDAWGELFLGGAGVGRGYLRRPDLTADRFGPDSVSGLPGARLYRTGDRARWRMDGTLEYGGRADDQVKLRGVRIELGEVEAALRRLDGIVEAAAVVGAGATELSAYVVARDPRPTPTDLRSRLQEGGMPTAMLPGRFVFMDALPCTSSGKLDRRALPASEGAAERAAVERVAPRDDQQAALAAIWSRVLRVSDIGIHDNFFDLGGHSLTAARVAAQVSRDLSTQVSVRDLFTYPTIAELSAYLTAVAWVADMPAADGPGHELLRDVTL